MSVSTNADCATSFFQALKALRETAEQVEKARHNAQDAGAANPADMAANVSYEGGGEGGGKGDGGKRGAKEGVSTPSKEDEEQSQVLLGLGALLSREPSAAVQVLYCGMRPKMHWAQHPFAARLSLENRPHCT